MVRKRAVEGFGLLLSYLAASCGSRPRVDPRPVSACEVPTSRVAFDSTSVEQLAGEYRLIFVSDSYPGDWRGGGGSGRCPAPAWDL
jgi:hypothetical protein